MVYGTAADTATRLAIGTAGYVLRSTGSAPAWSNIGVNLVTRKTSDETVNSGGTGTTFQNDDELLQAILASEVWEFNWDLYLTVNATPGIKFAVTVPASATIRAAATIFGASESRSGTSGTSGAELIGNNASYVRASVIATVVNSTNAGNVNLQFAQKVSDANNTTVLTNSILTSVRLA